MGKNRILVADAEASVRQVIVSILQEAGHECAPAGNVEEALSELYGQAFDVAFIDLQLPGRPWREWLKEIHECHPDLVVVVLASAQLASEVVGTVRVGAYDYLMKPVQGPELLVVTDRALERHSLHAAKREYEKYLEQVAEDRAVETRRLFYSAIQVLVRLTELRIPFGAGHAARVAEMSRYVARELKLTVDGVRKIYLAGLLHDLGMFTVGDAVLNKRDTLTPDEYRQVWHHASVAEDVLKPILMDEEVLKYVRHHHERYDGTGYPDGLKGNIIPLGARILAVAEAFDSMTRERPYRQAYTPDEALGELKRCSETQFDPQVVSVFAELYHRVFRNLDAVPGPS